jgi:sulfite reductase alpha subunit-like flavoprotein
MRGLCTGYLDDLEMGSPMSCLHRPMPTLKSVIGDGTKPIILIASGSGIAPLRPVWQLKANNSRATGDLIFFYGCKTRLVTRSAPFRIPFLLMC